MNNITFISTVHKAIGKCNADELYDILKELSPDVIFLEALDETYSFYEKQSFSSFGVYHKKLEVEAIQKYSIEAHFNYVPVLDNGLSDFFEHKYNHVCKNFQLQKMLDEFNSLASEQGFQFLNSDKSIVLQEKMRKFELSLLNDNELNEAVNEDIDSYENTMIRTIHSYCRESQFDRAVFLCGVAHRHSIIKKIERSDSAYSAL